MKKLSKLLPFAMLFVAGSLSATVNGADSKHYYLAMHKQLGIMSNIMQSSFTPESGDNPGYNTQIDSVYLQGQGIVFTVNSSTGYPDQAANFNFVLPPMPPLPALAGLTKGPDSVDRGQELSKRQRHISEKLASAQEKYQQALNSLSDGREHWRDIREAQRDMEHDVRSIDREIRDLDYQLLRANKEAKNDLKQVLMQLKQQKVALKEKATKLNKRSAEYAKQKKDKQLKRSKQRQSYYTKLSQSLAETLCLYGNGLKALNKNESVNIILKSAGERVGQRYQDKIFTYKKSDINACTADKINVAKLIEKAKGYQF